MKKRVNIYPRGPITTTNPPIRVPVKNVTKDTKDIRRCILAGAKVEEVLDNGVVVLLNLNNYDVENPGTISAPPEKPVDKKVVAEQQDVVSAASTSVDVPEKVETKEVVPPVKSEPPKKEEPVGEPFTIEDPNAPHVFREKDENGNFIDEAPVVENTIEEVATEEETAVEDDMVPMNEVSHLTKKQRKALRAKERSEAVKTNDPEESVG